MVNFILYVIYSTKVYTTSLDTDKWTEKKKFLIKYSKYNIGIYIIHNIKNCPKKNNISITDY